MAAYPAMQAGSRVCPHCKATILESAAVCPGCKHHLRFDKDAKPGATQAPRIAWQVEGTINPELETASSEYCIMISVRNEKNDEVARQVVNVGALQGEQRRTFTLSVEMSPAKSPGLRRYSK